MLKKALVAAAACVFFISSPAAAVTALFSYSGTGTESVLSAAAENSAYKVRFYDFHGSSETLTSGTEIRVGFASEPGLKFEELKRKLLSVPGVSAVVPDIEIRAAGKRSGYASLEAAVTSFGSASSGDVTPNDAGYPKQWNMTFMSMPKAWNHTAGVSEVVVAVLDTGTNRDHPDLLRNVRADASGNYGYDAVDGDDDPSDPHGHGTHVAGIIGASGGNGVGIAGVNWSVSILPVRILGESATGTGGGMAAGIEYVLKQKRSGLNVRVVNCSFTSLYEKSGDITKDPYYVMYKALSDAGIFVIAASGNQGENLDDPKGVLKGKIVLPASLPLPYLYSVGALESSGGLAGFGDGEATNYGKQSVHVFAPGKHIPGTVGTNALELWSGTSMAAPHVAGLVALAYAMYPTARPTFVDARLKASLKSSVALSAVSSLGGYFSGEGLFDVPGDGSKALGVGAPKNVWIAPGDEFKLTARVHPYTAEDKTVTWKSLDSSVVEVDSRGTVSGRALGSAIVEATPAGGGYKASIRVTVTESPHLEEPLEYSLEQPGCSAAGFNPASLLLILPAASMFFK